MQFFLEIRVFIILSLVCLSVCGMAPAASEERIQVINEYLEQYDVHPFLLDDLKPGDKISVRVDPVSGSLEPVIALVKADIEFSRLEALYKDEVLDQVNTDDEYQVIFPEFADRHLGAWRQGGGKRVSLVFHVENDEDYLLLVFGADSWIAGKHIASFGDYRLQIGVNAPQAIEQDVAAAGATIAQPIHDLQQAVQEFHGTFPDDDKPLTLLLTAMRAGETLFVYVEADDPSVNPVLKLRDFGGRLLTYDNIHGSRRIASFQHVFTAADQTSSLEIKGLSQSWQAVKGDFRVLIGINTPEVLQGKAAAGGRDLIREPLPVTVAIQVDQISSISQKNENFTVVSQLQLRWVDPKLAFNPASCKCSKKVYGATNFRVSASDKGIRLPGYIFLNQQGKRHIQEDTITIRPDGSATWYERFSVTLQAPDFDFRRLPFDTQQFFIRLALLESTRHFVFVTDPEFNLVGEHLGEEEWRIPSWETSTVEAGIRDKHSQFNFVMHAERHIMYYVVRIFVPLGLLIAVAWVSFFLRDYSKRVDVSSGNLLAFIAFNFTLGSDVPRLGYLTFLDEVMVIAFAFAALTVIYNVLMRYLERAGKSDRLERVDSILLWTYPFLYLASVWALLRIAD
jgi:hypothetical protein